MTDFKTWSHENLAKFAEEAYLALNRKQNMSYEAVEIEVIRWAEARRIIPNAKPYTQLLKAFSEMGELADAEIKEDMPEIKDAVGDVMVCLINYCALKDINLVKCLEGAYQEIKDRKGTLMPNGVFIKQ
jgi:NTP pyrophosphatase (non-canonical NTP hydrolase)|tara:strand:- start:236 stop:622 length:387 start_codon:yes stop_codon:yes gene_type:complete